LWLKKTHVVMVYFRRDVVRRSIEERPALSHTSNTELSRELLLRQTLHRMKCLAPRHLALSVLTGTATLSFE
jgi:hypothetical protein